MLKKDELEKPLLKKAKGFSENEITEEYEEAEGHLKLKKRKVSTKYFPPDISAAKLLLVINEELELKNLSEEELVDMRKGLMEELKQLSAEDNIKIKKEDENESRRK